AIDHRSPEVRTAAADALALFGRRQIPVSDDLHSALLRLASSEGPADLRESSARALAALAPPIPSALREEIRKGLIEAVALPHTPPALASALAVYPPPSLETATSLAGASERARVYEGLKLMGAAASPAADAAFAAALDALGDRALAGSRDDLVHLVDALPLAHPLAVQAGTHRAARRLHDRIGATANPTLAHGVAHCATAELVDRGKAWPARTLRCGLGLVPPDLGSRRAAAILRDAVGEDVLRANFLTRLYRVGPDRARVAVLDALVSIPIEAARPLLLQGLASENVGVVSAALRLLIHHRVALLASGEIPAVMQALAAARATLGAADDAPALALLADALAAIPDARHADALRELSAHPNRAVREAARRGLAVFPGTEPAEVFPPPRNSVTAEELAAR
ncbi:MAG: hypothetical protein H5U40_02700, partial [Polyangiaceae bacterium]|nr:hypothetical protein [Polyangiaceae bacterium]